MLETQMESKEKQKETFSSERFRSVVLRVMSPARFRCATELLCLNIKIKGS
jgi:hypothetical protein